MRISKTNSGRMVFLLNRQERTACPGPYGLSRASVSGELIIYTSNAGNAGYDRGGHHHEWALEITNDITNTFPAFGMIDVKAVIGSGKIIVKMPEHLPAARLVYVRKPKPPVVVNNQAPAAPHLPMRELVAMINQRRAEATDQMVFSIDAGGYLRVMVEYGLPTK